MIKTFFAAIAGLGLALAVHAEPSQAYKDGLAAYQRGDVRAAISVLRSGADAGDAQSQSLLAEILDWSEQNEEAAKYFGMAAAQDHSDGIFGLAAMQAQGEGMPRDVEAARAGMVRAAEMGHERAIKVVALAYIDGGLGLGEQERQSAQAVKWLEKAAALDALPAIDRLALAYRQGHYGLATDVKKAEELEARARALRGIKPEPKKKRRPRR